MGGRWERINELVRRAWSKNFGKGEKKRNPARTHKIILQWRWEKGKKKFRNDCSGVGTVGEADGVESLQCEEGCLGVKEKEGKV